MPKRKKGRRSGGQRQSDSENRTSKILLAVAVIELVKALVELFDRLIE